MLLAILMVPPIGYIIGGPLVYLMLCGTASLLAHRYGRSAILAFFGALLWTPVLAYVVILSAGRKVEGTDLA